MTDSGSDVRFDPWPLGALRQRLAQGTTLASLCGARVRGAHFDVRENVLEAIVADVVRAHVIFDALHERVQLRRVLQLPDLAFPARTRPDMVLRQDAALHVLEVKAGKTDDSRSQCVLSESFRSYLAIGGHRGPPPWEVEQDLIKLGLIAELADTVLSGTFLMIDAYSGRGRWWSDVFSSPARFRSTMRTRQIQEQTDRLLAHTTVEPLVAPGCTARLIVCRAVDRRPDRPA